MSTHIVAIGNFQALAAPPNTPRTGVIGGFAMYPGSWSFSTLANAPELLGTVSGRSVKVGGGIAVVMRGGAPYLCLYQPWVGGAITAPDAPANQQSWLWLSVAAGVFSFYWNTSPSTPTTAGDALIGWAIADAMVLTGWSQNVVWSATLGEGSGVQTLVAVPPPLPGGPGPTTYGDTDAPGAYPTFGSFLPYNGTWVLGPMGWGGTPTNIASIATLTFQIYYVAEAGAQTAPALTADVTDTATTFNVSSTAPFTVGNYYVIDEEIIQVTAIGSGTITVARGQVSTMAMAHWGPKSITGATNAAPIVVTCAGHGRINGETVKVSGIVGNTAANQNWQASAVAANTLELYGSAGNGAYVSGGTLGGSVLYPIAIATEVLPFAVQFFTSVAAPQWSKVLVLPGARLLATRLWATNAFGDSPVFETGAWAEDIGAGSFPSITTPGNGARTRSGGSLTFQVDGTLGIVSNAAQPVPSGDTSGGAFAFGTVSAAVETAATGAAITLELTLDGSHWCTLTIADGGVAAAPQSGLALGAVPAGAVVGLHVIGVGTTFPGAGLTVVIQ